MFGKFYNNAEFVNSKSCFEFGLQLENTVEEISKIVRVCKFDGFDDILQFFRGGWGSRSRATFAHE